MPPQEPQMQTAPDPRAELERLRKMKRLRELEAKAGGQPAAPAAPSQRSEIDAIIEEAAAAIPGGFAAFDAKPADPKRMAAMGYVPDPLAKSGYARPQAQQPRMADTGNTNSLIADVARGLEAPVRGLTGGGLEGWARTTQADPLLGATQAVDFISPVDDLGRAYQGVKQAGAGLIEGDMGKAAQGAQQASIDGSFAALQMLPGSMTLRGMTGPRNALAPTTLAGAERAAVQATRAPPVGKAAPQVVEASPQPAPFSAPAEPKSSNFLRNNADRIVGGGVGAFAGSAGDAFAASGGDGNGGPDIINPVTGAFAGMIAPRVAARGYRAAGSAIRGGGFNEAVAVRAARNALAPAGRSADEIRAVDMAQFGDKPSVLADLTQNAQNFSVGLSRQPGRAAELASEQSGDLARTRTGRLFTDVQATTKIDPATVTGDIDAAIKQASEEISPAYEKLFADNAGVNSERLMQLADDPVVGPYVRRAIQASESLQTTAGQAPSNARIWDLVKRGLDRTIESQKRSGGQAAYELEKARGAIKDELDALMPEYKPLRDAADAPRMRDARKQGAQVAGGGLSVEKVRAIASKFTGKPLTALQMGAVEKIVLDIERARGLDGLSSERMREVFGAVFDRETADNLVARIRADQTILKNAQRRDPDFGSATSQAGMADRGMGAVAADAFRAVRNPLEAGLAMLSRSGAYTQDQRNRIAEMLYGGATDENLARIYGNRPPRNALNVEPPPTPQGPPVNRLGMSGSPEALGAAGGTAIGMATAPDQNGDGVVDAQERMLGGAGGALTGGIAGRGVRALGGRASAAPAGKFRGPNQQTFAGVNAKTADKAALARAQNMEAEGASRDDIWDATGWFKGVDGKWRFEIDDSGAKATSAQNRKLRSDALDKQLGDAETASIIRHRADRNGTSAEAAARDLSTELGRPIGPNLVDAAKARTRSEHMAFIADLEQQLAAKSPDMKLGEAVGHSAVYDAYPDMAERPFKQFGLEGGLGTRAAYDEPADTFLSSQFQRPEEELSSSLHEMQHGVQGREGFARGGSEASFTQQKEAELARDAIHWRREIAAKRKEMPKADWIAVENALVQDFKKNGIMDWLPSQKARDLARDKISNPDDQLQEIINVYGLDRNTTTDSPRRMYERLAGETEARNVQTRRDFTPEQRRAKRPWETQDVPDDQQIVRFAGGKSESRPKGPPLNKLTPPPVMNGVGGGKGKPSTFIANTKATKPMATEFDGVDIQMPSDKSGTGRVAIKSERGEGEITFTLNERGDYVVKESRLDADMRGQGLGVKMYEALAQRAAASRRAMYSDSLVSGDAVKIYMALKRRGYNVRLANPDDVAENPNFRPSTWDENRNVLFPAGPKSKPGTIVASPSDPSVFKVTKYGIPAVGGGSLIVIMEPDAET